MRRDLRSYLWDVQACGEEIQTYIEGKTFAEYQHDSLTRRAVERCFEIIGEALVQASRHTQGIETIIPGMAKIIAFRNVLIHEYTRVEDELVWETAHMDLPELLAQVRAYLLTL